MKRLLGFPMLTLALIVSVPVIAATKTVTLSVPGMNCAACPITVKKALGKVPGVANPIRMSGTPISYRNAAPALGQHTDEVLHELGLDDAAIAKLRANKSI